MDTTTNSAGTTGKMNSTAAAKGAGTKKAAKVAKPRRAVVLGVDGVAQVEAFCETLAVTVGFKPTQAQAITWLITRHAAQAAVAADAA